MNCSPWGRKELDTTERLNTVLVEVSGVLWAGYLETDGG